MMIDKARVTKMIEELTEVRGQLEAELSRVDHAITGLRELGDPKLTNPSPSPTAAPLPMSNANGSLQNGHIAVDVGDALGRLLELMRKDGAAVSAKKLRVRLKMSEGTTYHLLDRARKRGYVTRSGTHGNYRYALIVPS